MKTISNEQKAREIAEYLNQPNGSNSLLECYQAAMAMAQWKDEQHKQEKQQWIDKLEDWLANNICTAHNFRGDNISATFMNDCIKAIKGE